MQSAAKNALKVLVVENNREAADCIARGFAAAGHIVRVAEDVEIAINLAVGEEYDFVITDVALGTGRGRDIIAHLKDDIVAREGRILRVRDLTMDLESHTVVRHGHHVELQPAEYKLLEYMMRHPGRVVTRENVLFTIWHYNIKPLTNIVESCICRLRDKLGEFGPDLIETVRGVGYTMRA